MANPQDYQGKVWPSASDVVRAFNNSQEIERSSQPSDKPKSGWEWLMHHFCRSCRHGPKGWCTKYFFEGQTLTKATAEARQNYDPSMPLSQRILIKYRRPIAMFSPAIVVHILWWSFMGYNNTWYLFKDKWPMTLTMVLGGLVAGMTTMGGGAVAFPVMTLALQIDPSIARDFSLMVQGSGMSCASFAIFFMGVKIDYHAIIIAIPTGLVGLVLGLHFADPALDAAQKKMVFVSIFFAFGLVLFILNRYHKRRTFDTIPDFKHWKALVLVATGFVGGIFTSLVGGGLDITNFAMLTTLFRVSEKTATPTSVVMMATVSFIGVIWRALMFRQVEQETWEFIACAVQIVTVMAPLGSLLGTHFHRQVLAAFVIILTLASFIAAYCILHLTAGLVILSVCILIFGVGFFFVMTILGQRLLTKMEKDGKVPPAEQIVTVIRTNGGVYNDGYFTDETSDMTYSGISVAGMQPEPYSSSVYPSRHKQQNNTVSSIA